MIPLKINTGIDPFVWVHLTALADMFDKMTMDEQRRYLDEDARAMGLFDRR